MCSAIRAGMKIQVDVFTVYLTRDLATLLLIMQRTEVVLVALLSLVSVLNPGYLDTCTDGPYSHDEDQERCWNICTCLKKTFE